MSKIKNSPLSIGLAMFSMFFGAGNITFPLMIGQTVEGGLIWALLGLIITSVVIPFSGMLSITLFEGDYEKFFNRIGQVPGMAVIVMLICLIGPFGGIPRCITLTYSTLKVYFTGMHLLVFSVISSLVIFLCSWKKNRILDLIGYVLSPLLILFLLAIIVKGIFFSHSEPIGSSQIIKPFLYGIQEGYNTMDLLASFFFSSLIYNRLKQRKNDGFGKSFLLLILKSSLIGAVFLSTIYVGFSYVGAYNAQNLLGTPIDQLLGKVGKIVLGHKAGLVVSMSIGLTCLTTAIALTVISAEFLQKKITKSRLSYEWALVAVLITTVAVSALEFTGIIQILLPVLKVIYPSLLVLSLFNILHKIFDYKPVKFPVFTTASVVLFFQHVAH